MVDISTSLDTEIKTAKQYLEEIESDMENFKRERKKGKAIPGISTSIHSFDSAIGGFQLGLHIIAGKPGLGKTGLSLNFSTEILKSRIPVIMVTCDEPGKNIAMRLISSLAGDKYNISTKDIRESGIKQKKWEKIRNTCLKPLARFHIVEGSNNHTISDLANVCFEIQGKSRKKCILIIDYIQKYADILYSHLDMKTRNTKLVADLREKILIPLKIPIVAISSLNRSRYDDPSVAALKESGDLEYAADTITILTSTEKVYDNNCRKVCFHIVKNRFGELSDFLCDFDTKSSKFKEENKR